MVDSHSFSSIRVVLICHAFCAFFFFSDLVQLSYCSFSAYISSFRPVPHVQSHALFPSCPFLTLLLLPVRSCLVNVQADLAQCLYHCVQPYCMSQSCYRPILSCLAFFQLPSCPILTSYHPVPPFPDSVHTALSSYRPLPLFISYFPVLHCPVPPSPVTVLSQPQPSYPELKATYIMKYTLSFFHVLHLHIESVVNGISSLCEKCQSNFFF